MQEGKQPFIMPLDDRMDFTDAVDVHTVNEVLAAVYLELRDQFPISRMMERLGELAGTETLERWMFQILVQETIRKLTEDKQEKKL